MPELHAKTVRSKEKSTAHIRKSIPLAWRETRRQALSLLMLRRYSRGHRLAHRYERPGEKRDGHGLWKARGQPARVNGACPLPHLAMCLAGCGLRPAHSAGSRAPVPGRQKGCGGRIKVFESFAQGRGVAVKRLPATHTLSLSWCMVMYGIGFHPGSRSGRRHKHQGP